MHPIQFPGLSDTESSPSEFPQKRIEPEEGERLLREAQSSSDPRNSGIDRLLRIRRWIDRSLRLNPETGNETPHRRIPLALECSTALRRYLQDCEEPVDGLVDLELHVLDSRNEIPGARKPVSPPGAKATLSADVAAYEAYVMGMIEGTWGDPERGAERLAEALDRAGGHLETQVQIGYELFPLWFGIGQHDPLISTTRDQVMKLTMHGTRPFEIGWALHWEARAEEHAGRWRSCVESARESNLHLFRFGASQNARTTAVNYFLVARGMAELDEWGEAAALAQLSLRALEFEDRYPSRANALYVLARCLQAFNEEKSKADARGILTRLLEQRPSVAESGTFFQDVEQLLKDLGPGPVSPQPG